MKEPIYFPEYNRPDTSDNGDRLRHKISGSLYEIEKHNQIMTELLEKLYTDPQPIAIRKGANLDAFGRIRVANPVTLFDTKQIFDNAPRIWDDVQVSGTAGSVYSINRASSTLTVNNLTAGRRVRQSKRWINYQPLKAQLIMMTCVPGAQTNVKYWGQMTDANGVYWFQNEGGLGVGIRSNVTGTPVNRVVYKANWNLMPDIVIDHTKAQIFFIDYEWLGVGIVRFGVVQGGVLYYVHEFSHTNELDSVYMSSPNLPLRYELVNDGTGPADFFECICCAVASEGGTDVTTGSTVIDRDGVPIITLNDSDIYPLLAYRLKPTAFGATVFPHKMSLMCTSTAAYRWDLRINPTFVGVAPTFVDKADSVVQECVTTLNTTKITGGRMVDSGYAQSTSAGEVQANMDAFNALGSTYAGVSDIMCLTVQRLSGTTETFYGSLGIHER